MKSEEIFNEIVSCFNETNWDGGEIRVTDTGEYLIVELVWDNKHTNIVFKEYKSDDAYWRLLYKIVLRGLNTEHINCECNFAMIRRDQETQKAYCFQCGKEIQE